MFAMSARRLPVKDELYITNVSDVTNDQLPMVQKINRRDLVDVRFRLNVGHKTSEPTTATSGNPVPSPTVQCKMLGRHR
jgi:hypothetical protein